MLLDSNIIIYSAKPEHDALRKLIAAHAPADSAVSVVEVLGFHRLSSDEKKLFEEFFAATTVLPISPTVVDQAVRLRQQKKMTLGDSLVAATALVSSRTLVTRNVNDFVWIPGLQLLDPLAT